MWVIDRTNLILFAIALGIVALVGAVLLSSPGKPSEVVSAPGPEQTVPGAAPTPLEPDLVFVQPEPAPASSPEPVVLAAPSSSDPMIDGIIHTGEYAHALEAGGFRVYWANDDAVLRMGLSSPGTGYVAIGLDPDQRMQGANFIIAAVRNGRLEIRDDYGTGPLSHGADTADGGDDDILASAGRELNGQTTVEFIIPLDSGDRFDKPLQPGETYGILVAFHDTDDDFSTRHSQRGSGEIRLDDTRP